jgi:hypothetical protein
MRGRGAFVSHRELIPFSGGDTILNVAFLCIPCMIFMMKSRVD